MSVHPFNDDYDVSSYQNLLLSEEIFETGTNNALNNKVFMRDESGNLMWSLGCLDMYDKLTNFIRNAIDAKSTIVARFIPCTSRKRYTVQIGYLRFDLTYLVKLKNAVQFLAMMDHVTEKDVLKKVILLLRRLKEKKYSNIQNLDLENIDMETIDVENIDLSFVQAPLLNEENQYTSTEMDPDVIRYMLDRYGRWNETNNSQKIQFGSNTDNVRQVDHDHSYTFRAKEPTLNSINTVDQQRTYTLISLFLSISRFL